MASALILLSSGRVWPWPLLLLLLLLLNRIILFVAIDDCVWDLKHGDHSEFFSISSQDPRVELHIGGI